MKKTFTTITLAIVFTFGATFANAGVVIGGRADSDRGTCTNGILVSDAPIAGILVSDLVAPGILVSDLVSGIAGVIIGGRPTPSPCKSINKNGILVSDAPSTSDDGGPTGGVIIGG